MIEWPDYLDRAFTSVSIYGGAEEENLEAFASRWGGLDLKTFVQVLKTGQGKDKIIAIFALGYSGIPEAQALLLPLLESHERMERWASALCLGKLKDERALPYLQQILLEGLFDQRTTNDRSVDEAILWYENWRPAVVSFLCNWENPQLAPFLRHALQTSWQREQQVAPSEGQRYFYHQYWHHYQDALCYGLGRLGAFGALLDLELPASRLRLAMIHLVLGHLHAHLTIPMSLSKDLAQKVATVLEQRFGFSSAEQAFYIEQFSLEIKRRDSGDEGNEGHVETSG